MTGQLVGIHKTLEPLLEPFLSSAAKGSSLGISENGKAVLASIIAKKSSGPTLFLAATPTVAEHLTTEIGFYYPSIPVLRFPEREHRAYETSSSDDSPQTECAKALQQLQSKDKAIIVTSWIAASELRAGPNLSNEELVLTITDQMEPVVILRWAESNGYTTEKIADSIATIAQRGGILDIFPINHESPYRLEFLGNSIESIRKIDPSTQRSSGRLEQIIISPAKIITKENQILASSLLKTLQKTGEQTV